MLAKTVTYNPLNYANTLGSGLISIHVTLCLSTVKHDFQSLCKGHMNLCTYSMIADLHKFLGIITVYSGRAGEPWKLLHPSHTHIKIEKLYVLSAIELIPSI